MAKVVAAEVVSELEIPDVRSIHGVTCDGRSVWFAADDGDLLQVDPKSGAVESRTRGLGARAGTAFDGTHLWVLAGDRIDRIDPATRTVVSSIPAPDTAFSGMAWGEGALWIGQCNAKRILKVDPKDGRVLKTIQLERMVTGVSWAEGDLWHGTMAESDPPSTGGLHRVDPESGTETLEVRFPEGTGCAGIEYDSARGVFWCGSHDAAPAGAERRARLRAVRKPSRSARAT